MSGGIILDYFLTAIYTMFYGWLQVAVSKCSTIYTEFYGSLTGN